MTDANHTQEERGSGLEHRSTGGEVVRIGDYQLPAGIQIDTDDERVIERLRECISHPLAATFTRSIQALDGMTKGEPGSRVKLWMDFAPLSFEWALVGPDGHARLCGGLIYHGSHDGYGSGAAPTFSVSLANEAGWQLHT